MTDDTDRSTPSAANSYEPPGTIRSNGTDSRSSGGPAESRSDSQGGANGHAPLGRTPATEKHTERGLLESAVSTVGRGLDGAEAPIRENGAGTTRRPGMRQTTAVPVVGHGSVAPGAKWFTTAYAIAFAVGVIPTFISHQLWMIPLAALVIYTVMGQKRASETGTMFEFADSAYYLGFTLSIGSLLASLEPFNTVKRPDPEQIFHFFGLGLLTTLLGVVIRTLLQTYHRLPAETFEEVNRRVTDEASRYLVNMESLNAELFRILDATAGHMEKDVLPRLERLNSALDQTIGHLDTAAQTSDALGKNASGANEALQLVVSGYTKSVEGVKAAHATLAGTVEALNRNLGTARGAVSGLSTELETLKAKTTNAAKDLGDFATRLNSITIDAEPLKAPIAAVGEVVASAARAAEADARALSGAATQLTADVRALRTAARTLQDPVLGAAIGALETQVSTLATAVSAQRTVTATEVETLRGTTKAALDATTAVARTLDEIARAATVRLESGVAAATVAPPV